jgi:hypothetical protein
MDCLRSDNHGKRLLKSGFGIPLEERKCEYVKD